MEIRAYDEYFNNKTGFWQKKVLNCQEVACCSKRLTTIFFLQKYRFCAFLLQYGGVDGLQFLRDIPKDVLRPLYDELDRQIQGLDQVCF